jgi:hypothetical protein
MATNARIGWGSEVWFANASDTITLLGEVISFGLPDDEVEEVEATHLKSPDRRREFIAGMQDSGEIEVTMNYVPGSATDLLIMEAKESGETRPIRFVLSDNTGAGDWQIDTTAFVRGYARGPISPSEKAEATVRFRITGASTEANYVAA